MYAIHRLNIFCCIYYFIYFGQIAVNDLLSTHKNKELKNIYIYPQTYEEYEEPY